MDPILLKYLPSQYPLVRLDQRVLQVLQGRAAIQAPPVVMGPTVQQVLRAPQDRRVLPQDLGLPPQLQALSG